MRCVSSQIRDHRGYQSAERSARDSPNSGKRHSKPSQTTRTRRLDAVRALVIGITDNSFTGQGVLSRSVAPLADARKANIGGC